MEDKIVGFRSLSLFFIYLIYELKDKKSIPVIKIETSHLYISFMYIFI